MKTISRRSVLGTIFGSAFLSFILPSRATAADQPHMQEALDALQKAKRELDAASDDKGGHRVKAQRLVNQAIAEVQRGLRFDRRN